MDGETFAVMTSLTGKLTKKAKHGGDIMSMRGEIISKEYQGMVFVRDKEGKEYACYLKDLKDLKPADKLTEEERKKCMDISLVLGDTW